MDMTEILASNGIDGEKAKAILEAMKTNKMYISSEENLDIRYGKLKTQHDSTSQQLTEAQTLIEELKKGTKGQESMQQKITAYETQVSQLQTELEQTKLNAAIKVELLSAKAADVDYLTYKLGEKLKADGDALTLDDNGNIKGWDDKLAGLKTQFPAMFAASEGDGKGYKVLEPNKLPTDGEKPAMTRDEILKKPYAERAKLFEENPEAFRAAVND